MERMTPLDRNRWQKAKKNGYASVVEGVRMVLKYDDQKGTVLVPLTSLREPGES